MQSPLPSPSPPRSTDSLGKNENENEHAKDASLFECKTPRRFPAHAAQWSWRVCENLMCAPASRGCCRLRRRRRRADSRRGSRRERVRCGGALGSSKQHTTIGSGGGLLHNARKHTHTHTHVPTRNRNRNRNCNCNCVCLSAGRGCVQNASPPPPGAPPNAFALSC